MTEAAMIASPEYVIVFCMIEIPVESAFVRRVCPRHLVVVSSVGPSEDHEKTRSWLYVAPSGAVPKLPCCLDERRRTATKAASGGIRADLRGGAVQLRLIETRPVEAETATVIESSWSPASSSNTRLVSNAIGVP